MRYLLHFPSTMGFRRVLGSILGIVEQQQVGVCEESLRKVLAMRRSKHLHNFDLDAIKDSTKFPEIWGDVQGQFHKDGLSGYWTLLEAKNMEDIGIDAWLQTKAAAGFAASLEHTLKAHLFSSFFSSLTDSQLQELPKSMQDIIKSRHH